MLESIKYSNNGESALSFSVLDQLLLPHESVYVDVTDIEIAWTAIRTMQIRGAPLIAIVAVLGLSIEFNNSNTKTFQEMKSIENDKDALLALLKKHLDYLKTSRPTAVNLFNACEELSKAAEEALAVENGVTFGEKLKKCILDYSEMALARDIADNKAIGAHGADAILSKGEKVKVMTICNTGSLATVGFGTALGVVREIMSRSKLESIAALETRPYNQGSRLTSFEIVSEKMPGGLLICDSMAATYMKTKGCDVCVVGADRICRNGDTANKIGTFNLAIVAKHHNVPFYIAAPFTTIDMELESGDVIPIEERPWDELIKTSIAPKDIACWNPAFDVTPAELITGIITEKGVIYRDAEGKIDVAGFVKSFENGESTNVTAPIPAKYEEQNVDSLPSYLAKYAPECMKALDATSASDLKCQEVGDGNLNLVFIVSNSKSNKQIIAKQALPYVRCVGESWPLTVQRAYYEHEALVTEKEACPAHVPTVYHFSKVNGLIVMEYLPPPIQILRKGLIANIKYPTMAQDMGLFCAQTLFKTSGFHLSTTELRDKVVFWSSNSEMCALTEQVIFTEPYITAPNNRWTSPQLDDDKKLIETDDALKLAANKLKNKFVSSTDALIHADLHTGSVMCAPNPGETFVIDPEFAFYGPMGFDIGAFLANLLLAYVSQPGHGNSSDYMDWILEQATVFFKTFSTEFIKLWNDSTQHKGFRYQEDILGKSPEEYQQEFLRGLLKESLGFCGMKMLRRIVGIAHVEDLDSIEDAELRAKCERKGLAIAKELIKNAGKYNTIDEIMSFAKNL